MRERPPGAEVTSIEVEDYDGRVMPRESFASSFSLEQLSKLVLVGVEMRDDIKEMKGDIKEILEKQDETIQEIRNLREDFKSFIDERLSRLEADVAEIKARLGMG